MKDVSLSSKCLSLYQTIQLKGRLYSKLSYKSVSYNKISKIVKNVSSSSKWLSVYQNDAIDQSIILKRSYLPEIKKKSLGSTEI